MTKTNAFFVSLALLGACSSGASTGPDGAAGGSGTDATVGGDTSAADDSDTGAPERGDAGKALYGGVTVEILKDAYTGFLGLFYDAPRLPMMLLEPRQSQNGCTLYVPRANPCGGACPTGSGCGPANTCVPDPAPVDVGTLHVTGLDGAARDAQRTTSSTMISYQIVPTLPYPSCAEGAPIGVSGDGFALAATCIADLELTSPVPIPVTSGKATHLTWKAPAQPTSARVLIELEIAHHGGYRGQIDCDVADTGTFDIPEPLVTMLVALGRAGYPTVKLVRTSRGTSTAQPGVTLDVVSRVQVDADTGVISCGTAGSPPCAAPTTCQQNLTCQ